jgi:hypothetical protein
VPENSMLNFVTVEFGAFEFTGPLLAFGANYSIQRGPLTGPSQFVDTSRTGTNPFTNVLTSTGPQNLFTRLPVESGLYSWITGLGFSSKDSSATSALWDYRLTFGVESIAVPEPGPLALLGFGLLALFLGRAGARSRFSRLS